MCEKSKSYTSYNIIRALAVYIQIMKLHIYIFLDSLINPSFKNINNFQMYTIELLIKELM